MTIHSCSHYGKMLPIRQLLFLCPAYTTSQVYDRFSILSYRRSIFTPQCLIRNKSRFMLFCTGNIINNTQWISRFAIAAREPDMANRTDFSSRLPVCKQFPFCWNCSKHIWYRAFRYFLNRFFRPHSPT